MSLTINNTFMDGVNSVDKVQSIADATTDKTIKPATRVVLCTGTTYEITLPPAAEVPGVFLAVINKASNAITAAEPTKGAGMIAFAANNLAAGVAGLLYSSGVAWHAISGFSA